MVCGLIFAAALSGCESFSGEITADSDYPSTPRVAPVPVSDMNPAQKEFLGIIDGKPLPNRARSSLFRTLIHHPELMAVYDPMAYRVNTTSEIADNQRELLIMRVAWLYQGKYEWSQHYPKALSAGWTEADIQRIKIGADASGWNSKDKTLLRAVDQWVETASLDDESWADLSEHYTPPEIMTLVTLVTHYHWVAMISKTFGVQPDKDVIGF